METATGKISELQDRIINVRVIKGRIREHMRRIEAQTKEVARISMAPGITPEEISEYVNPF